MTFFFLSLSIYHTYFHFMTHHNYFMIFLLGCFLVGYISQSGIIKNSMFGDFPGGPVARHFHFGGPGSIFGLGSEISKLSGTWVKKDFNVFF